MSQRFSHSIINQGTSLFPHVLPGIGHIYYNPLKAFAATNHLLALPFAGWVDPAFQHVRLLEVLLHKLGDGEVGLQEAIDELLAMGHSQGCPRVVGQVFRPGSPRTSVMICFGGTFRGSHAANKVRFLRRIPKRFRGPIEGVVQMMPGSESEAHLEAKILAALEIPGFIPPDVYLVAALHDDLVSVESAFYWPDAYPSNKVHRILVAHGLDKAPEGVTLVKTRYGWDNHYLMVRDANVIKYLHEVLAPPPGLEGDAALAA